MLNFKSVFKSRLCTIADWANDASALHKKTERCDFGLFSLVWCLRTKTFFLQRWWESNEAAFSAQGDFGCEHMKLFSKGMPLAVRPNLALIFVFPLLGSLHTDVLHSPRSLKTGNLHVWHQLMGLLVVKKTKFSSKPVPQLLFVHNGHGFFSPLYHNC